jgi:RNA polymerase sigma-70 factor (ECF subfamily)
VPRPVLGVIDGGRSTGPARLSEWYGKYGGAVYGRCRFLLRDATLAEDALQDVFAKALSVKGGLSGVESPLTWLMKVATHHCLNLLRAKAAAWREQVVELERAKGEAHGGQKQLEDRDLVRRALAEHDVETQAAVVHYFLDEMTLVEVAALLERSVPTVRKRLEAFAEHTGKKLREADEVAR